MGKHSPPLHVPFNRPHMTGREFDYIAAARDAGVLAGDGPFTRRCHEWLRAQSGSTGALLTHSCTAALEMAALLLEIGPGDEVIMPSYTFVSTANAFVLRGATPVFVDVRADTLNIDERLIEQAITSRTRAIVAVHYAGVGCEMDAILEIAMRHGLVVVEDAAQGVQAAYRGRALGSFGTFGALSFHETKNVISGEGGALIVNDASYMARAEIIREKGTDRSRFFRGEVDKYSWQDIGSSYLPGELTAAFLWAQMQEAQSITARRLEMWQWYDAQIEPLERSGRLRRPFIPRHCSHNAHMYYVLLAPDLERSAVLNELATRGVHAVSHYVPLHSAPAGRRFARACGPMTVTDDVAQRLIRLPLWIDMGNERQQHVVEALFDVLR